MKDGLVYDNDADFPPRVVLVRLPLDLKQVYQRVVCRPVDGVERLWRECEEFEMAGNEHLWKNKFSIEYLPK